MLFIILDCVLKDNNSPLKIDIIDLVYSLSKQCAQSITSLLGLYIRQVLKGVGVYARQRKAFEV